jgi:hypothetical protein
VTKLLDPKEPYVFILTYYVNTLQASLFPWLEAVVEEPLTDKLRRFVFTLEQFVFGPLTQEMGRKEIDRRSIARAYVATLRVNIKWYNSLRRNDRII